MYNVVAGMNGDKGGTGRPFEPVFEALVLDVAVVTVVDNAVVGGVDAAMEVVLVAERLVDEIVVLKGEVVVGLEELDQLEEVDVEDHDSEVIVGTEVKVGCVMLGHSHARWLCIVVVVTIMPPTTMVSIRRLNERCNGTYNQS